MILLRVLVIAAGIIAAAAVALRALGVTRGSLGVASACVHVMMDDLVPCRLCRVPSLLRVRWSSRLCLGNERTLYNR